MEPTLQSEKIVNSYHDGKHWWVIIPDDLWDQAEFIDYYDGYPLWTSQRRR